MSSPWVHEKIWIEKPLYDEAECEYYTRLSSKEPLTPLADEVGKFRQRLSEIKDTFNKTVPTTSTNNEQIKCLDKRINSIQDVINILQNTVRSLEERLDRLDARFAKESKTTLVNFTNITEVNVEDEEDDDDVNLFLSDSEEDEAAVKIREERLAAYKEKKSRKPAIVAKSNIILEVKPWDDETDMNIMEEHVKKIETDGLLWGAAKLVPLAYGIQKLQISCVIEDDKVSVDWLQEQIESIEDFVQSVDIAAFNKV